MLMQKLGMENIHTHLGPSFVPFCFKLSVKCFDSKSFLGYEARCGDIDLVFSNCLITDAFNKDSACFSCFKGDGPGGTRSVCYALEDEALNLLACITSHENMGRTQNKIYRKSFFTHTVVDCLHLSFFRA